MQNFHRHVVHADTLSETEQAFWQYLSRQLSESEGSTTEFQIETEKAYEYLYGRSSESPSTAAKAVSDLLESLRTKGICANLEDGKLTRFGYVSGSIFFPKTPEIMAFTIDDFLGQLVRDKPLWDCCD